MRIFDLRGMDLRLLPKNVIVFPLSDPFSTIGQLFFVSAGFNLNAFDFAKQRIPRSLITLLEQSDPMVEFKVAQVKAETCHRSLTPILRQEAEMTGAVYLWSVWRDMRHIRPVRL